MAIQCPQCGKQYDSTLFAFGRRIQCDCGTMVDARRPQKINSREESRAFTERIRREADRICQMILKKDIPWIDIEIAKECLKEKVLRRFPDRLFLYRMIYESRFQRLREQFREEGEPPLTV